MSTKPLNKGEVRILDVFMEKHNFTLSEVIELMSNKVSRDFGITKKKAKKLIAEALSYNTVIYEIEDKINYLLNSEE